jgi:hypothetical protein
MTVSLDDLRRRRDAGSPVEPEIHSIDGRVYIVRVGDQTLSGRGASTPLHFPSAWAAGRALGRIGLERGWLVHSSPYDEMIGRSDEHEPSPPPLRTALRFSGDG